MSEENNPQGIFQRAAAEEQRYQQMIERERELGVSDPEREAIDDALVSRVADAIKHSVEGLTRLDLLGTLLGQSKPRWISPPSRLPPKKKRSVTK